jgi:hypothetical protein
MAKPYKITKEKNEHGTVWRFTCRFDPSITGTAFTRDSAIFWAERKCPNSNRVQVPELEEVVPNFETYPDLSCGSSCSNNVILRSSAADFQTLMS